MNRVLRFSLWILLFLQLCELQAQNIVPINPLDQKAFIGFISQKKTSERAQFPMKSGVRQLKSSKNDQSLMDWSQFCQTFGRALVSKPTQTGFLQAFECSDAKNAVPKPGYMWQIEFIEAKRTLELHVFYGRGEGRRLAQLLSFRLHDEPFTKRMKQETAILLARILMESLPTGWVFVPGFSEDKSDGVFPSFLLPGPRDLYIFDLFFAEDQGVWLPRIRSAFIQNGKQAWTQTGAFLPLRPGQAYWSQYTTEDGRSLADYNSLLDTTKAGMSVLTDDDREFFERLDNHSFTGVFFPPLRKGESITTRASLAQFRLEMNRGIFDGLRLKYEAVPEIQMIKNGKRHTFYYNRASIGWGFTYESPRSFQKLYSRLVVDPKMEVGSLGLQTSVDLENGLGSDLAFDERLILFPSLGLSLERMDKDSRHRLYASLSSPELQAFSKDVTVASRRAGYEYFKGVWTPYPGFRLNLTVMAVLEQLAMRKNVENSRSVQDLTPSEIKFSMFFAGGGLALTW